MRSTIAKSVRSAGRVAVRWHSTAGPLQENDIVVLRPTYAIPTDITASSVLSPPLSSEPGRVIRPANLSSNRLISRQIKGTVKHSDLIGKVPPILVDSSGGNRLVVSRPSLAEHILLSRRLITPIYPADAAAIVGMLDVNLAVPTSEPDRPVFRLLEAGTGHGSLTLHLARAVHCANPPGDPSNRTAIVYSLDTSESNQKHAEQVVRTFRQGLYRPHVEFINSDPTSFLTTQDPSDRMELDGAVLDLPGPESHMAAVVQCLRPDAPLLVFVPSVMQIAECIRQVRNDRLPLVCDRIVELSQTVAGATSAGGREWDVRIVVPRKPTKSSSVEEAAVEGSHKEVDSGEPNDGAEMGENGGAEKEMWVCRPKSGTRMAGGGFVGQWRKKRVEEIK